jgi:hypothetical protein
MFFLACKPAQRESESDISTGPSEAWKYLESRYDICLSPSETITEKMGGDLVSLADDKFSAELLLMIDHDGRACGPEHFEAVSDELGLVPISQLKDLPGLVRVIVQFKSLSAKRIQIVFEFIFKNGKKMIKYLEDSIDARNLVKGLKARGLVKPAEAVAKVVPPPAVLARYGKVPWKLRKNFATNLPEDDLKSVLDYLNNNLNHADMDDLQRAIGLVQDIDKARGTNRMLGLADKVMERAMKGGIHPQTWTFNYEEQRMVESFWSRAFDKLKAGDNTVFLAELKKLSSLYSSAPASAITAKVKALSQGIEFADIEAIHTSGKAMTALGGASNWEMFLLNNFYRYLDDARTAEVWWRQGGGFHNTERIKTALTTLERLSAMIEDIGASRTNLTRNIDFRKLQALLKNMHVDSLGRRGIDKSTGGVNPLQAIGIKPTDSGTVDRIDQIYDSILGAIGSSSTPSNLWKSLPKVFYRGSYF